MRGLVGLSLLCLVLAPMAAAGAASFTREGLTFSDELGGFRLVSVTGTGRLEDPFVVVEEIGGQGPAILLITGLRPEFGNRCGTQHLTGFAMTKLVRNVGNQPWHDFRMELRENERYASPYGDGLSFGQAATGRTVESSTFHQARVIDEPYDGLAFEDGEVPPGAAADFHFLITDETPAWRILLIQDLSPPTAALPPREEPAQPAAWPHPMLAQRPEAAP
ncbi:hypothetical protein FRZ61_20290 [Hypericibacter adhaerens]|jgi:hypothetical protein|uniref:Uncharacterized protein n=1 Tax=Hypericibacter adhaerens TaxID=2602016 RepID=A0A5J6N0G0_9PROT|nr:hypothetical protein [Hypericibacter adhaerens]QEX22100.1 hypothetical protein FRZ61_20290 [Hypericibacter adhaerens]